MRSQRDAKLANVDLTDDDFSNGCVNCTKEQFEQYMSVVTPGQKVIVLPEEEGNYFTVKGDKLSFTTNRDKEFGQYNYTPKNKEATPFNFKPEKQTEYTTKFVDALTKEKANLMKDLNLSNEEYDELAKRAYGIFGQESSFGEGSKNPLNDYRLEELYTVMFDKPEERKNRSLGLTQVRMKHVNSEYAKKYGIDEKSLYYPYQAALATMERLADSLQAVKNPKVRDKYEDMTPENVYDYAVTFYNKPETTRLGNASGKNSYVQNITNYASGLKPNEVPNYEPNFTPSIPTVYAGVSTNKIDSNFVRTFEPEKLKAVQKDLQSKGLYAGSVDGKFGPLTEKAIDNYNAKFQKGGITEMGYKDNSPYKNRKKLKINSNQITMEGVSQPLLGVGSNGEFKLMLPGQDYNFNNADYVMEYKLKQGGYVNLLQNYLPTIPENQQDELLDTLDALPEQERYDALEEYMNGGCYKCGGEVMQSGGHTPTYPELGQGNVEVEDQETVKTPDGKLFKFEGDTHEQGGIQTQLPGGSIIFSDHIKAPQNITELVLGRKTKKKYSYADLSKKFATQKSLNTLKNPDSDPFEINTAELTLNKNQAMLDTIFSAQEAEKMQKSKSKFQDGGITWRSNPNLLPSQIMTPDFEFEQLGAFPYPTYDNPFNPENYGKGYEDVGKSYPFDSGRGSVAKYLFEPDGQPETVPQATPTVQTKKPTGKGRPAKTSAPVPIEDNFKASVPLPFDPLQRDLSSIQLSSINQRNPFEKNQPVSETEINSDTENYPGFAKSRGKSKFGINPKLAGTIMDIGLALSDNLNVEAPILFNNKTYPLFNRFVNFDNKEPGRNLALSVQQIQNSNMPEQVKQAQIAQLTAQANEQQSQVDFGNQQRYEQKQERDINKLQQYQDRNTLVGNQDLENYLQRKGRVESLKNEFKARRKSNIVNSIRGFADYASDLHYQNQIYGDNYKVNILTGNVDFTGQKQDPLKQQELLMSQFQSNAQNAISLPNGVTVTMISPGVGISVDANGKAEVIKL